MSSTETGLRPGPDAAATRGGLDAPLRDREARIVARPESDAAGLRRRLEGTRSSVAFPYLLLPSFWSSRNRARRRERGDSVRLALFGCVGLAVLGALFGGSFWVTLQLDRPCRGSTVRSAAGRTRRCGGWCP